jgi:Polyketide cyclase / dehydrase and lipid transport
MRTFTAATAASPEAAWRLLASPSSWPRWSPHVRGAWNLGTPEVRRGAVGAARLLGVVPVPARIVGKRAGRSWTWRVGLGLVEMVHRVEPRPDGGATVAVDIIAPGPVERALAAAYGPLIELSLRRLAAQAERGVR